MPFASITVTEIRPYLRFVIKDSVTHSSNVSAYEHRLIYINEGSAKITVNGEHFILNKNDAIFIKAGIKYKMTSDERTLSTYIYFDMTMENSNQKTRVKPDTNCGEKNLFCHYSLTVDHEQVEYFVFKNSGNVRDYIENILNLFATKGEDKYTENIISGLMIAVLSTLLANTKKHSRGKASVDVAAKVLEYIHLNYEKPITVDDIANSLNFHKSYISRSVQKEFDTSVHKYLLHYRLKQALQLLMYTEITVSEVAEKTGFVNPKNFSTAFKKYYGISPSKILK